MITFLPYSNFAESALVLDRKRLGKQRLEVLQILMGGWPNHPASKMWQGYTGHLVSYGLTICNEWTSRGYVDSIYNKILDTNYHRNESTFTRPPWLGDEEFHASHRGRLLMKDYSHYSQFGWQEQPMEKYKWPVLTENGGYYLREV